MGPVNSFYNDADLATNEPAAPELFRSPFQRDRDRIIYSSAFRRLQAKTQVFVAGEFDFYRTRLTHSLEVAQIGRSIAAYLNQTTPTLEPGFALDTDLIEAICLAHDLGHAPFGHAGERTLHQLMRCKGGFEGNAQSLRIITETIYPGETARRGMNPTRAFVDGILKYKRLFRDAPAALNHFIYDDQVAWRDFALPGVKFSEEIDWNRVRSLECQIMDWADDTAYCLNDLVDSINAGFLRSERIERWASGLKLAAAEAESVEAILSAIREGRAEARLSRRIGVFIRSTRLVERSATATLPATNRYRFDLEIEPAIAAEAQLFKCLSQDLVFDHSSLHQLERKAKVILEGIFAAFSDSYLEHDQPTHRLLPESFDRIVRATNDRPTRVRILCDYIAGMTDGFAVRTYKRLFDPGFGSIVDLA
ncbi:MAG: dNTP triphosphohydrolase [Verrucomicrobia bacterium]|nr:dNTP triphosphohydrolase [Verrucomicrobiota bacterium]